MAEEGMSCRLRLSGIRAAGRHGASPGEQEEPQDFLVDLDVDVEVDGDILEETADYRALAEVVRAAVERESYSLLETLAAAVAHSVAGMRRVSRVRVTVHKPSAARSIRAQDVAAEATAS